MSPKILVCLLVQVAAASVIVQLQGPLRVASSPEGNGLLVTEIALVGGVASSRLSRAHSDIEESSLQSAATIGKDSHEFSLDGDVVCVARLKNSTSVPIYVLCDDGRAFDVAYPANVVEEGCLGQYILPGLNPRIFYIGFAGQCPPLRIDTTQTPFLVRTDYRRDLAGRKVAVVKGEITSYDGVSEQAVFYGYFTDGDLVLKSSNDGTEYYVSASSVGSCAVLLDLQPLHFTTSRTLDLVLKCTDSEDAELRYLLRYSCADDEVVDASAFSEARGTVQSSETGEFVAIRVHRNELVLYDVKSIRDPATIISDRPISARFLQSERNLTFAVLFGEGKNVTVIDVSRFTSTHGAEGRMVIPNTTVQSCDPCPYAGIVDAGDDTVVMVTVFDLVSLQFDLKAMGIGSRTVLPTVPRIATSSPVFSFSQTSSSIVPVTDATSEGEGGTTPTTFEPSPSPITGGTDATEVATATVLAPTLSRGAIIAGSVVGSIVIVVVVSIPIVALACRLWRSRAKYGHPTQATTPYSKEASTDDASSTNSSEVDSASSSRHHMTSNP